MSNKNLRFSGEKIVKIFQKVSTIPRCSSNEGLIIDWIAANAENKGCEYIKDDKGNLLVKVKANSDATKKSKSIALQAHVDMVCKKNKNKNFDFSKEKLKIKEHKGFLHAEGTTLGADNGIGVSMMLDFILGSPIKHPPLELLFTIEEEIGLKGAAALKKDLLESKILLNLDTERDNNIIIGCAGGHDTDIKMPIEFENINEKDSIFDIKISGLKGGHSGVDIDKQRGNAIKIAARKLNRFARNIDFKIINVTGGDLHNTIPNEADIKIIVVKQDVELLLRLMRSVESTLKEEYSKSDPEIFVEMLHSQGEIPKKSLTKKSTKRLLNLINALPHGVDAMCKNLTNIVETSTNVAKIFIENDNLVVYTSQRSSVLSRLSALSERIESISQLADAEVYSSHSYPAWESNYDSKVLKKVKRIYKKMFKHEANIGVIHAGLECGIIADIFPKMEILSIGPNIIDPHSPIEKVEIASITKTYNFLLEILENLK